ncbi:unnamed protein product [Rotaria sp. Silwood1]|nr:unnamed protein product [Rotaria sp. Silwood1]CAF5115039.1 unnamed protein product [Rotaria sp. Silwood1]
MLAENNETIDGWVFSNVAGILSTPLGLALDNSFKNKTGLKLWGSLESNNGTSTFRMQSWSKHQSINLSFYLQTPSNNITCITDALASNELTTIRVSVIDIRPSENYTSKGITRTSTFILIGDQTATCYLLVIDLSPGVFEIQKAYDITKIRKKFFNGSYLLTTTIDTHISLSNTTVMPNIDNVTQTMNINLNDRNTITTTINEVGQIRRLYNCSTCQGDLNEVKNAAALLFCEKCHRHILKINVTLHVSTTIVLQKGEEKIILFVNDQTLCELLAIIGVTINMLDTDIVIAMMSSTKLTFEYSELRKELLAVTKPN